MSLQITEQNESYLECIADLIRDKGYARVTDIAEVMEVTTSTVSNTMKKLEKMELVDTEKYGMVKLKKEGQKIAQKIQKRHKILVNFLQKLDIPEEIIEKDVDGLEHHLSEVSLKAIEDLTKKI